MNLNWLEFGPDTISIFWKEVFVIIINIVNIWISDFLELILNLTQNSIYQSILISYYIG